MITDDPKHPDINVDRGDGQNKAYLVLSDAELAKGFVRPVRDSYVHIKGCKSLTKMGYKLAETYARDPSFYGATYCCSCGKHFPVDEFVWDGTDLKVGS